MLVQLFVLPDLLASYFRTNWLSWLWLGNQVGSTNDHLANCYQLSTPKDQSTMRAELTGLIVNRGWGKCNMRAWPWVFYPILGLMCKDRKDWQERLNVCLCKEEFGVRLGKLHRRKVYRKVLGVRIGIVPIFTWIIVWKICPVSGVEPMPTR